MELYDLGYLVVGFVAGMAWGSLMTFWLFYATGKKKKAKTQVDMIEERIAKIEDRLDL
jgi:F0F1-type ATP synthase membrane subunit b/b'